MAERGMKLGKLLDISNMPGVVHAYIGSSAESQEMKWYNEE